MAAVREQRLRFPRRTRGLTFVTVLLLLAIAGGVYWVVTFGPAYWDDREVKSALNEAANLCYHEPNDQRVREFILRRLHSLFDREGPDGKTAFVIDLDPADLRIERSQTPKRVDIWLTYSRTVKTPGIDQPRIVTFVDHVDQDLSDVKW
jgi:hypothetical protein